MTKEEIKDLQKNLISLVPSDIRNTKELTKSDKILLGQLIYLYGMDKAKANGYVFRSNDDLENDTKLSSQTIRISINRLIKFGAINRTVGSRAEGASVYTLNFEITPKITPKNHPYMTKDEVEVLIEAVKSQMRAEFQKKINDLHDDIAKLEGVISDKANTKSPLKITPIQSEITPQIQNTDKETTNHSKTIENNDYRADAGENQATFKKVEGNDPDEIAPSNMGETGDVCDFQNKIEGEVTQSQPDETTPDDEQTTIEYLTNLEMTLRDEQTNLNHDEVIELSNKLKAILDKWGQFSHIIELTTNRIVNLINWFASDLITLADVRDIFAPHLRETNGNPSLIADALTYRYQFLNPQDAGNAQIWAMTPSVVQTTNQSEETRQMQNKVANPVSGNADLNPQNTEEPQAKQNKATGSVSAPQMGKLSTDTDKRAQISPEDAGEPMTKESKVNEYLEKWREAFANSYDHPNEAENDAVNIVTGLLHYVRDIKTIEELNWSRCFINRAFDHWGRILGNNLTMFYNQINRQLDARQTALLAA